MGATRWQTIWQVAAQAAQAVFTAVVFEWHVLWRNLGYPDGCRVTLR